ncbi:MAG: hypothetical protein LBU88_00330 [Treponema sp.]|jgi:hypothetical protein|nr:hypothetical protein [Treponema sp.]
MLITNFASGELSKTLFGRIDLPQYYSGAARLENFDVIPTGGIKRRSGMKRLQELDANGRLIPFIVNREESYIFIFSDAQIDIYRAGSWEQPVKTFTNEDIESTTLYTENEIYDIQYAQNQRIMVIAHPEHPPIVIEFTDDDITINTLEIKIYIKQEHAPELESTFEQEEDKYYLEKQYLMQEGQYPRCVTFFNGRLVFAATERDTQRLFFSAAYNYNDFSTYKQFIIEIKNYVFVRVKISNGSCKIQLYDDLEAEKIATPDTKTYYIETRFFPEGSIVLIPPMIRFDENGNKYIEMESDKPAQNLLRSMPENIERELDEKVKEFNEQNEKLINKGRVASQSVGQEVAVYAILIGASFYKFGEIMYHQNQPTDNIRPGTLSEPYPLPWNIGQMIDDGTARDYLINEIMINSLKYSNTTTSYNADIARIVGDWIPIIKKHNKYEHPDLPKNPYYGTMPEIRAQILRLYAASEIYIPIYTIEQKKDEYPTPDNGFMFEIASGVNDAIRWLSVNRGIIVGTELSEWFIPPDVHSTNTQAVKCSSYGCDYIPGEAIGESTCFFQTGRRSLVEYYPNEYNFFRANNMAMLSTQMLHESPAKEFDYTAAPFTKLYITRDDGQMVTLLYDRSSGTFAWGRITTGEVTRDTITPEDIERAKKTHHSRKNTYEISPGPFIKPKKLVRIVEGEIQSAAVLPGESGFDEVFLIVKRNGGFYLELLKEDGDVYLDSWGEYNGDRTGYTDDAIVHEGKIGYSYTSIITSMPIQANHKLKQTNIKNLNIRFCDSYMPFTRALPSENENSIKRPEPNSDVVQSYFPGGWNKNLQFEIIHEKPTRCCILAVYAEAE